MITRMFLIRSTLLYGLLFWSSELPSLMEAASDTVVTPPSSQSFQRLRSMRSVKPKKIEEYEILTSQQIEERLVRWSNHYEELTQLTTAQEDYDLARAGDEDDCPFVAGRGCPNSILIIQDFVSHPEGSDSSNRLPEVLWSGELHGNERVGPTAVMHAAELLLDATACIALPRLSLKEEKPEEYNIDIQKAKECRLDFEEFGINVKQLWWLARLVSTRRIVVVPTANALGYYRQEREENGIDVNRDFPFDYLPDSEHSKYNTQCMQSIAARTLNEVFRDHMFQLSLTFHAGMQAIGYEWGAPTYGTINTSPDDAVQSQIAAAYSRYAGGWQGTQSYPYGPMNTLVYPVRGGMEDWAYAGSWDPDRVIPCQPSTYRGYDTERTQYNNSTLRVLNMLVETSDQKTPQQHLGSSWDLLDGFSSASGNGHVSRNARLALLAAELVEPWLSIRNVNEIELTDDIIPMMNREQRETCQQSQLVKVPKNSRKVVIEWVVGGALHIADTRLWYAKWADVPDLTCVDQPSARIKEFLFEGTPISETSGQTRFASTAAIRTAHFSASLDLTHFKPSDKIVVLTSAQVDLDWATQPSKYEPANISPQSHMANVRTNPNWFHTSGEKVIQGRLDWFSRPLTIEMGQDDKEVHTFEVSLRIRLPPPLPSPSESGSDDEISPPSSSDLEASKNTWPKNAWSAFKVSVVLLVLFVFVFYLVRCILRERIRYGQRSRIREFIENKDAPNPGTQHAPDVIEDEEDHPNNVNQFTDEPKREGHDEEQNGVEMGRFS